ncbi:MAG: 5' nucleotidase, NT5C type [Planctomycetota bacterium]
MSDSLKQEPFILGLDLDGCTADFYEGLRPIAAEWLGVPVDSLDPEVTYGLPEWGVGDAPGGYKALHRFAVTQRDLFRNLEPMYRAPQMLRQLSSAGIQIRIITHRLFIGRFHQTAVQQTIGWLDHHDIPYYDLCFMGDKKAVGAHLYIEDAPHNIKQLREDGNEVLVFANSTNRDVPGPRAENWKEAGAAVLAARDRWLAQEADLLPV